MAITYGGDEVSAVVLDIGTHTTRAGYAGEETPRCVISSWYGWMEVEVDVDVEDDGGEVVGGEGNGDVLEEGGQAVKDSNRDTEMKDAQDPTESQPQPKANVDADADADGDIPMSTTITSPTALEATSSAKSTSDSSAPTAADAAATGPPSIVADPSTSGTTSTPLIPPTDETSSTPSGTAIPTPTPAIAEPPSTSVTKSQPTDKRTQKRTEKRLFIGESGPDVWRAGMEVASFLGDGIVTDPAPLSGFLSAIFHQILHLNPPDHPLLVTEPAWAQPGPRELLAEIAFEGEGFPGFYSACGGVLSAFSAGKGTALIVDIGADLVSVTPISDGYAMKAGLKRQPLAMTLLNSQIKHYLQSNHPPGILTPHQLIKSRSAVQPGQPPSFIVNEQRASKTTDSWREYAEAKVVDGWREACCEVSIYPYQKEALATKTYGEYEFPNGYNAKYGVERFRLTEMLFDPVGFIDPAAPVPERLRLTPDSATSHSLSSLVGLSTLITNSIRSIDVDHRPLLLSNIVLVGSGSMLPGIADRINADVSRVFPGSKVKIHSPGNTIERRWSGWLGGSILASLGTFQQLWVARSEWDQHGPIILKQRCK